MEPTRETMLFHYGETWNLVHRMLRENMFTEEGARIAHTYLTTLEFEISRLESEK